MLRTPAVLDRRGTRWAMRLLSPAPVVVLVHRGRSSGKVHRTPVEALAENREHGRIVVSPLWGERSHWYRNILAGGLLEIHVRGQTQDCDWRELPVEERREALGAYRREHPRYSRVVLGMLARANGLDGDPAEAVIEAIPMLELRPAATRAEVQKRPS